MIIRQDDIRRSKRIYHWVVAAYIAGTLICAAVRFLQTKAIVPTVIVLLSLLYLLIMPLLFRILRLRPSYLLYAEFAIFVFLAFTLGVSLRWYTVIWWYDLFAHALSGSVFVMIGLCAFYMLQDDKGVSPSHNGKTAVGFGFCFSMMCAAMWEIIEYTGFLLFGYDSQNVAATGVGDTMEDMMICLAGTVITCILLAIHLYTKWKIPIFIATDEFYRLNCGSREKK